MISISLIEHTAGLSNRKIILQLPTTEKPPIASEENYILQHKMWPLDTLQCFSPRSIILYVMFLLCSLNSIVAEADKECSVKQKQVIVVPHVNIAS